LIFAKNLQNVADHNSRYAQGLETYIQKINEFSDVTFDEFIAVRGISDFDP
jgi:hypothetical protein